LLLLVTLGCEEKKPRVRPVAETSATFDMEDIAAFLERVSEVTHLSFDRRRAELLTKWIREQDVGSETRYVYAVVVEGRRADMEVVARIEDHDAVDLHFATHPELVRRIELLFDEFFADVGK
jgi:hypothetical protein